MANTTRNSSGIKSKGGNLVALRRVLYDGSVSGSETWFDVSHIEKSELSFERALETYKAEDGEIVATESGDVTAEFKVTLMQSDSNTLNFFMNETDNKYFAVVKYTGEGLGITKEFVYMPLTRIQTKLNISYPGRRPELTITPLAATQTWNAVSLSAGSVTAWTPSPISLSATLQGSAGSYLSFAEV